MEVSGTDALERFRTETGARIRRKPQGPPLPLRQLFVAGGCALWFGVTIFWYRGGLDWPGHIISACLGAAAFLLLFVPLPWGTELSTAEPSENLRRLLRFPCFWLGLLVLIYCGIQIWNVKWISEANDNGFYRVRQVSYVKWLPTGVQGSLDFTNNPFTGLLQIMLPWLMLCTLWSGVRSRRVWMMLANGILAVCILWVLMALWHYYTKQQLLYGWIHIGRNNVPPYWGSFRNPNHGAFIQLLAMSLAATLGFVNIRRALESSRSLGLGMAYMTASIFFSFATLQSLSRGAIALAIVFWGFLCIVLVIQGFRAGKREFSFLVLGLALVVALGGYGYFATRSKNIHDREFAKTWTATLVQLRRGDEQRELIYKIGWRYHRHDPVWGTGIGSWVHFYARWFTQEERLTQSYYSKRVDPRTGERVRTRIYDLWEHAHCDWLQYLCELGWVGAIPLYLLVLYPFGYCLIFIRRAGFVPIILLAGVGLIGIGSVYEFPTRTPAIGLLTAILATYAMTEIRRRRSENRSI